MHKSILKRDFPLTLLLVLIASLLASHAVWGEEELQQKVKGRNVAAPVPLKKVTIKQEVSPMKVLPGERVTIRVFVENPTSITRSFITPLKVRGTIVASKKVTLLPRESRIIRLPYLLLGDPAGT